MRILVAVRTDGMRDVAAEAVSALQLLRPVHEPVHDPGEADVILYLEPGFNKFRRYATTLLADDVLTSHLARCFVYDFCDRPVPFLPGLYWALPRDRFDEETAVACHPWRCIPDETLEALGPAPERRYLFSFRGSDTARVRSALLAAGFDAPTSTVTQTYGWYDHSDTERHDYLNEMRASRFVLCPRGLATSTFRMYEAMQLGRAPVILSDAWVAPSSVPWEDFSIRLAENRVREIPSLLRRREGGSEEMGALARQVWEAEIRPGPALMAGWLRGIESLLAARRRDWDGVRVRRKWTSQRFQWRHNIHPLQGVAAGIRQRNIRERLRARREL